MVILGFPVAYHAGITAWRESRDRGLALVALVVLSVEAVLLIMFLLLPVVLIVIPYSVR